MNFKTFHLALALLLTAATSSAQQPPDPVAAAMKKMRDALRTTMLQLQTAETERAALQTAKAEAEEKIKTLTTQLAQAEKKSAEQKAAAEKEITELKSRAANQAVELTNLSESLEKWKKHDEQAVALLKAREADRSRLTSEKILLERKVADREARNAELYRTGKEILTRYEKFGLGRALLAREPFTGISRAKLETLAQDFADKLADQKIKSTDDQPAMPLPLEKPAPPAPERTSPPKRVSSSVTKP